MACSGPVRGRDVAVADVRFDAHSELAPDIAPCPKTCTTGDIARREALLSPLEHVHRETIGVDLATHVGPKAIHLIALDTFNGHQWPS
jgi:hypothetical protein